jgi:hypothetical protein
MQRVNNLWPPRAISRQRLPPVDAGKTCRRADPVHQINLSESEPFSYSVWPRAIATSAFVLRPRGSGFRNPSLVYGDVEDLRDLVSLEEQIRWIAACGIRSNLIWNERPSQQSLCALACAKDEKRPAINVDRGQLEFVEMVHHAGFNRWDQSLPRI